MSGVFETQIGAFACILAYTTVWAVPILFLNLLFFLFLRKCKAIGHVCRNLVIYAQIYPIYAQMLELICMHNCMTSLLKPGALFHTCLSWLELSRGQKFYFMKDSEITKSYFIPNRNETPNFEILCKRKLKKKTFVSIWVKYFISILI